jgi:hypothetical protein
VKHPSELEQLYDRPRTALTSVVPGVRPHRPQNYKVALDFLLLSAIIDLIENSIWSAAALLPLFLHPGCQSKAETVADQQTSSLKSIKYKMQIS